MAVKTPTERLNELERLVALLNERLDAVRKEIEAANAARLEVAKELATLRGEFTTLGKEFVLVQKDVVELPGLKKEVFDLVLVKKDVEGLGKWKEEMRRERDESARRLWAFGPNIVAAIISGIVTLIGVAFSVTLNYWLLKK